ncbi:hypothetical protein BRARA_B00196 [Brassica rapa]|uniref:Uncharacterized protein n=1 Tax=Brassica campestris TaxID=3711 RepID=A0A398ACP2_BRACM|nr:hypothetical protein BRARA_B00196 [Brassica rapa]
MEHIFNSYTQLRYGRDLRLNEVRRLLCSARPVVIQTSANPTISDQEQQQDQLWRIAQRTAVLPLGRGAFTLSTIHTLLTEAKFYLTKVIPVFLSLLRSPSRFTLSLPFLQAFTVPKLVLAGRLPAQQNAVVNLDPNIRNIQDLKTWPEFHNAVAAGLRLAPLQGKVSRTWIKYNKPAEPNAVHAGLLFGLGLQGYLHVLNLSDIYQYFTQENQHNTRKKKDIKRQKRDTSSHMGWRIAYEVYLYQGEDSAAGSLTTRIDFCLKRQNPKLQLPVATQLTLVTHTKRQTYITYILAYAMEVMFVWLPQFSASASASALMKIVVVRFDADAVLIADAEFFGDRREDAVPAYQ